jgi:hypothetical protein
MGSRFFIECNTSGTGEPIAEQHFPIIAEEPLRLIGPEAYDIFTTSGRIVLNRIRYCREEPARANGDGDWTEELEFKAPDGLHRMQGWELAERPGMLVREIELETRQTELTIVLAKGIIERQPLADYPH